MDIFLFLYIWYMYVYMVVECGSVGWLVVMLSEGGWVGCSIPYHLSRRGWLSYHDEVDGLRVTLD